MHAALTLDMQPECIRNFFTYCKLRTSDLDNAAITNVDDHDQSLRTSRDKFNNFIVSRCP